MKKTPLILSIVALAGVVVLAVLMLVSRPSSKKATVNSGVTPEAGAIVYFNLDRVLSEYDMANDLRSVVETKVESINQEVTRRGSKLDSDAKSFQNKMDKGLLTRSVAEAQYQKLQEQQAAFQNYAAEKEQEIAEEQAVMMNQLADAIKTFVDEYNAEKQYAMILTTQGDVLPAPIVTADEALDITDDILEGLNAAYVESKK